MKTDKTYGYLKHGMTNKKIINVFGLRHIFEYQCRRVPPADCSVPSHTDGRSIVRIMWCTRPENNETTDQWPYISSRRGDFICDLSKDLYREHCISLIEEKRVLDSLYQNQRWNNRFRSILQTKICNRQESCLEAKGRRRAPGTIGVKLCQRSQGARKQLNAAYMAGEKIKRLMDKKLKLQRHRLLTTQSESTMGVYCEATTAVLTTTTTSSWRSPTDHRIQRVRRIPKFNMSSMALSRSAEIISRTDSKHVSLDHTSTGSFS
ncbi:hypothetical protein AAMO2058_001306800 [Amorphochlora amoebiformis]